MYSNYYCIYLFQKWQNISTGDNNFAGGKKKNEYVELTEPKVHSTHANANQAEASSFAACCVGNCKLKNPASRV
jgi:hypothetical protein